MKSNKWNCHKTMLINPELLLRGSSPTPGASDVGSKAKNIYLKSKVISEKIFYKKEMSLQESQSPKVVASDSRYIELERKIDSITNGLSRPYFKQE